MDTTSPKDTPIGGHKRCLCILNDCFGCLFERCQLRAKFDTKHVAKGIIAKSATKTLGWTTSERTRLQRAFSLPRDMASQASNLLQEITCSSMEGLKVDFLSFGCRLDHCQALQNRIHGRGRDSGKKFGCTP